MKDGRQAHEQCMSHRQLSLSTLQACSGGEGNDTRSVKRLHYVSSAMGPGVHEYDFWNKVCPGRDALTAGDRNWPSAP